MLVRLYSSTIRLATVEISLILDQSFQFIFTLCAQKRENANLMLLSKKTNDSSLTNATRVPLPAGPTYDVTTFYYENQQVD